MTLNSRNGTALTAQITHEPDLPALILSSMPIMPPGSTVKGGDQSRFREKPLAKPRPAGLKYMILAPG